MLTTAPEALRLIDQIADRAIELGDDRPKAEIAADLSMTHFSCPLRLGDFLAGDTIMQAISTATPACSAGGSNRASPRSEDEAMNKVDRYLHIMAWLRERYTCWDGVRHSIVISCGGKLSRYSLLEQAFFNRYLLDETN